MLWSPNEVLAYLKEDLSDYQSATNKEKQKVIPTSAFGGFETWPGDKEDFILIAENSEIHGPNPLFTIPELDSSLDLNSLSTQILSADYQGLSNNKILPGKNAQLLMPDLASDLHAAINYFFLFDSDARGFVRPTCLAYFTNDKHKLVMLAEPILKTLGEVAAILQHSNILYHINDLRSLKDTFKLPAPSTQVSSSNEIGLEMRLKDIQEVLDIVESYEGNELYDKLILSVMENLKKIAVSEKIQNLDSVFSPVKKVPVLDFFIFRPNTKTHMKNLYHICNNGLVLGLYHLFIMHKHFRRKYEHVVLNSDISSTSKGVVLHFGACLTLSTQYHSIQDFQSTKCVLSSFKIPYTFSLESKQYFNCLDHTFEKLLLSFIDKNKNELSSTDKNNVSYCSSQDFSNSSEFYSGSSHSSGYLSMDEVNDRNCGHIGPVNTIWDIIEFIKIENPGIEESFLQVLKIFSDTRRLLFAVLTRMPIVVISIPQLLHLAQDFVKALSIFIPRRKDEVLFVDIHRQDPLKKEDFTKLAVVNICLYNHPIEKILPMEILPSLCILNLKDCSFSGPTYTGCLLANIDQQVQILPITGPIFPVIVGTLLEIDRTIKWWHVLTSSSADTSTTIQYVLSKGYNRLDMSIIEKLSRLSKN
ncbi:Guanine nucleotide exchange protein smcr8b like protein [Argiope bruennichi]|uniref:Guanine nucleotide exchange protein smcr8b like protein n=1 Tax=Argiope bruennichi TaxID=94029 RepID=A0A8T0EWM1_ARGBR|nr:Guanine nucleotide exchange protein smcr8b like protein [Argiope bruennichi]